MNQTIQSIDKFHSTKKGRIIFGVIELALSYAVISRAFHTGSLWQYGLFILLLIGGLNNLVKALHGRKKPGEKARSKPRKS